MATWSDREVIAYNIRQIGFLKQELRIGQIISLCASYAGWGSEDVFYCPDDVLLKGSNAYLKMILDEEKGEAHGLQQMPAE